MSTVLSESPVVDPLPEAPATTANPLLRIVPAAAPGSQWRLDQLSHGTALVNAALLSDAWSAIAVLSDQIPGEAPKRPGEPQYDYILALIREKRLEATVHLALRLDTLLRLLARMSGEAYASHDYLCAKLECSSRSLYRARQWLDLCHGIRKASGKDGRWNIWRPTCDADLALTYCVAVPIAAILLNDYSFYVLATLHQYMEELEAEVNEERGWTDDRQKLIPINGRLPFGSRKDLAGHLMASDHRMRGALSQLSSLRLIDAPKLKLTPENARANLANLLRR